MVKPFEVEELVLRLKNILKRTEQPETTAPELLQIGSYGFDHPSLLLLLRHETGDTWLTEKEAQLLGFFCAHRNRLIKRNELLLHIWKSDDYFSGCSLDVFVSKLRKYLSADTNISQETVRGTGFEFRHPI